VANAPQKKRYGIDEQGHHIEQIRDYKGDKKRRPELGARKFSNRLGFGRIGTFITVL
jgi:hypothetical protein